MNHETTQSPITVKSNKYPDKEFGVLFYINPVAYHLYDNRECKNLPVFSGPYNAISKLLALDKKLKKEFEESCSEVFKKRYRELV